MRIYVDTSVINGFFCQDKTIQQTTADFFKQIKIGYTLYGSDLVAEEIKQTPDAKLIQALIGIINEHEIELLPISEEVRNLAGQYISEKIIPCVKFIPMLSNTGGFNIDTDKINFSYDWHLNDENYYVLYGMYAKQSIDTSSPNVPIYFTLKLVVIP